jgi:hypothetical protein
MNQQIQDVMRTQLIMSSGMSGGSWGSLRNIVLMGLYDRAVLTFPLWSTWVQSVFCRRKPKSSSPVPTTKDIRCEIQFERLSSEKTNKGNASMFQIRMDAVVHTVSKVAQVRHLLSISNHDYLPFEYDPILVDNDVYFQLGDIKYSDGIVDGMKFKLFCYDHESKFLQAYVEQCTAGYDRHMTNKLGTNLYFFDMMVQPKNPRATGIQNPLPTGYTLFTKHKFHTTRNFDNVFFDQRKEVRNHTEFFLKRKDWYEKKGIPHTLGFMFHGSPGCGKTSTIKAIANVAHRHVINIHLSEIKSKDQLRNLFFNDEINVWDNGKADRYTIPVNERIYVIEDIDAMGDTVLRREWKKPEKPAKKDDEKKDAFGNNAPEEENPIDLSFLLNLLDGTLETNGRILAVTTNFPERIDRALIRPGRIDMIVHFKKCSLQTLREMVNSFYDEDVESELWTDSTLNEKWSPAEVNQILFRNFNNREKALLELKSLSENDLYGFEINQSQEISLPVC